MEKLVYPACFYPCDDKTGYLVVIPDIPGCSTSSSSLADAMSIATDAASAYVQNKLSSGNAAPKASKLEDIIANEYPNGFVGLLLVDLEAYNAKMVMQKRTKQRAEILNVLDLYVADLKYVYGDDLLQVSLFGSWARGDFRSDSDIDILIIVKGSDSNKYVYRDQLSELTMNFNMEYDIWIEAIAMSRDYFDKWRHGDQFLLNVAKDEVRLYGDM